MRPLAQFFFGESRYKSENSHLRQSLPPIARCAFPPIYEEPQPIFYPAPPSSAPHVPLADVPKSEDRFPTPPNSIFSPVDEGALTLLSSAFLPYVYLLVYNSVSPQDTSTQWKATTRVLLSFRRTYLSRSNK